MHCGDFLFILFILGCFSKKENILVWLLGCDILHQMPT